jgi:hypothetical protein
MAERLPLLRERVDDIPRWLAQLERRGVQRLLDEPFPTHGHWVGLSLGGVTVRWLTPLLSQADQWLNHVDPWAKPRLHALRGGTGQRVHPLDVSDDRLAAGLAALRDDLRWHMVERALAPQRLRGYALQPERVRLDRTPARGSWRVTEDGLFQVGPSKAQRPDLPQVKVMLAALAPLGLPVATDVVPGQRADAPLDPPAITRVRERIERRGRLDVGDGTRGAPEPRAFVQAGGAYDLGPLSARQLPPAVRATYLAPVWTAAHVLTPLARVPANAQRERSAEGCERGEALTAVLAGAPLSWTERRRGVTRLECVSRRRVTPAQMPLPGR